VENVCISGLERMMRGPGFRGGLLVAILLLSSIPFARAQTAEPDSSVRQRIRASVERGLPYLETAGQSWIENKKCVSCHRISFLTWSFSAAGNKGFEIDRDKLTAWNDWSLQKSLEKVKDSEEPDGARNVDGLAQMMIGSFAYLDADQRRKSVEQLLPLLLKGQRPDGSWPAAGQLPLQKRPGPETDQVTTMWIALALGQVSDSSAKQARDKAIQWLEQAGPGTSTEWFSTALLLHHQVGDAEQSATAIKTLRSLQNADGGWGWLLKDKSDALSTGQSLYALSVAGVLPEDPAIQRAREFLLGSQLKDGSWAVPGTKAAKKDRIEETATYWGTAWAVLGLLETLR
jgi:hypothetical protein